MGKESLNERFDIDEDVNFIGQKNTRATITISTRMIG
jgi:hypothetical protein